MVYYILYYYFADISAVYPIHNGAIAFKTTWESLNISFGEHNIDPGDFTHSLQVNRELTRES